MKKIEAIIRQEKFDEVKNALANAGFPRITVYDVKGRGRQKGISLSYRTTEYRVDMLPKMKIELIVEDSQLEKAVSTILKVAKTGNIGDGKIFVLHAEEAVRIRTGERGYIAI